MAVNYLTAEGLKKLKDELRQLESVERPRISAAIAEAREKGDLSENAEYDAAREAQGLLELKISQLKDLIMNSRIIDKSKISTKEVKILTTVRVLNHKTNQEVKYTLVSEAEANFREGKIAIGTPIAKALIGKKVGEIATVNAPAGAFQLEVLEITLE
ncbi:MAG: transcription elongation factor GreA [Paludibacteraceae bacterium]|nr:transcription elongation factor GreA [Paludibacteraceae bacterium]